MKKVYYSTGSIGTAVIVANDETEARTLLTAEFKVQELPSDVKLERVSRAEVGVILLVKDGAP